MNEEAFYKALSQLADGDISPELFRELEEHLLDSDQARQDYREFMHLQSLIGLEVNVQQHSEKVVPVEKIISRQKRRSLKVAVLSAAAVLIFGLVAMRLFFVQEDPVKYLAIEVSPGTRFVLTHDSENEVLTNRHTMLPGSRMQLSQGAVELTFPSGVKSVVLAPADLTMRGKNELYMSQGVGWFHVPKQAVGFKVATKELEVLDLGTEFGVLAKPNDHDEVHVMAGKVEVTAKRLRMGSATLVAGEARRIDPVGRLIPIPSKEAAFIKSLLKSLPYLHWSFDEADQFQVKGTHPLASEVTTTALPVEDIPSLVPGKRGSALSLNGNGQHCATDWAGFIGGHPMTFSFWINIPTESSNMNNPGIFGWGDRTLPLGKWKVALRQSKSSPNLRLGLSFGQSWVNSKKNLIKGKWQHVLVTTTGRDDSQGKVMIDVYIDGEKERLGLKIKDGKKPVISTETVSAVPLVIGSDLKSKVERRSLEGKIDELYIFRGYMTEQDAVDWIQYENREGLINHDE